MLNELKKLTLRDILKKIKQNPNLSLVLNSATAIGIFYALVGLFGVMSVFVCVYKIFNLVIS